MSNSAYISESELARRANVPATKLKRAKLQGRMTPDFIIGRVHAYNLEHVPALIHTLTTEVE